MLKQSLPYIIVLVILVLLFSLFGYSLFKKSSEADKTLAQNIGELKQIHSSANLPSDKLVDSMQKDNAQLKEKYDNFRAKLPVSKELTLPKGVNLPLFFLEEFKKMKEGVKSRSKENQVLTANFGLPNTLPSEQESYQLIKKLSVTEMVVNLLLDVGVRTIDSIEVGESQSIDMYEDFPLYLTVTCDMSSLFELLLTLENTDKGFFIVREFSLISSMTSKEAKTTSSATMNERIVARRDPRLQPPATTGTRESVSSTPEKTIQVSLELSLIRWK